MPNLWLLKRKLKALFYEQKGQSLVEFALVLPLLLVLTLGTLLVTISFMHKSRMNAIAYTSARAAAVRGSSFDANAFAMNQYATLSGERWLSEVTPSKLPPQEQWIGVQLKKPAERFDLLVNLLGGKGFKLSELRVQMRMPKEYENVPKRTQTFSEIDYRYELLPTSTLGIKLKVIETLIPDALFNTSQMADPPTGGGSDLTQRDDKVGLDPPNTELKDFYSGFKWSAYDSHNEKPTGTLRTQQIIGEKFKALQAGGLLLDFANALTGIPLLGSLKTVMEPIAQQVESETKTLTRQIDEDLKESFAP